MAVDVAYDGAEALDKAELNSYDVIVLDRDLPEVHGDDVCRQLSPGERRPVLMLTAAGTRRPGRRAAWGPTTTCPSRSPCELVARIRALGRRAAPGVPPVLRHGDLRSTPRRRTSPAAAATELTEGVRRARGAAGRRRAGGLAEELLEKAWDENADPFTNAVRVTIMTCAASSAIRR